MKIGLVIPCFNEAKRLDVKSFSQFLDEDKSFEVMFCFVNDGSEDETGSVLKGISKNYPEQTLIIDRPNNLGKAASVREGILKMLSETQCDWLGFWDADLATPLSEIKSFRRVIEENPILSLVMGARILRLGANIVRHWYRHYIGRVFATLASLVLGLPVYDTQCGAKMFRREIARSIFSEPLMSRWLFDIELLFRIMTTQQYKEKGSAMIHELPLNQWHDIAGSKLRLSDFLMAPAELWNIKCVYSKKK